MDMNYLVQRKINARKAYRRKVILTIALSAILLVLIIVGLVKIILDEKKADDAAAENKGTNVSEQVTPGVQNGNSDKEGNQTGNRDEAPQQNGAAGTEQTPVPTEAVVPTETPTPIPTSVPSKKIAIDPGHGGEDLGSTRQGLYEKDANLAIALYLQTILKDAGYEVFMVRDSDSWVELEDRPKLANEQNVDLYISIHMNSLDADSDATQGAEVWYADVRNDGSDVLAQAVIDELTKVVDTRNRGIKLSNKLVVVRESKAPACLIECGFITSETERAKLFNPEYQQKLAQGIANGIQKYLPLE